MLQVPDQDLVYSTYVIYPNNDDTTRHWVTDELRLKVERELHKPCMFMRDRDEIGGEHVAVY